MKMHPFKLASLWLMSILLAVMVTSIIVRAEEPQVIEKVVVEYIIITEPEEVDEELEEQESQMVSLGEYNISAYCPCEICCGPNADGYTSSGAKAVEGVTIAADPKLHPAGTELYIEGVGWRTVQDTGGAIKGKRLDIFFNAHSDADLFGRQYLNVSEAGRGGHR